MSEPVNPLFEEEKEFLERKKLEYERALRGDVEHIKDQTVQVGKVALVGASVLGGIWLLSKAFGRRKKHPEWHHAYDDEAYDEDSDGFGDDVYADYEEPAATSHWDRYAADGPDYDEPDYSNSFADSDDLDDNGLSEFPEFEAHSSHQHGDDSATAATSTENEPDANRPFWSAEHSHPSANLPYDDSRRMPSSTSFTETPAEPKAAPVAEPAVETPPKKNWVIPAVMSFLQSETGRVVSAQVAAVALGLVTKLVKDLLPSDAAEPAKNSDLAASTAAGARAYGQPAVKAASQSPVSDAHDPDTDAPTYHSLA